MAGSSGTRAHTGTDTGFLEASIPGRTSSQNRSMRGKNGACGKNSTARLHVPWMPSATAGQMVPLYPAFPNQRRLEVLRCVQAVHVNVLLTVKCEVRAAQNGDIVQPDGPLRSSFFLGDWEDDHHRTVTVRQKGQTVVASVTRAGEKLLTNTARGLVALAFSKGVCPPRVQCIGHLKTVFWHFSLEPLLGVWEDDDDSQVTATWDKTKTFSLLARFQKDGQQDRELSVRCDDNDMFICGSGILQLDESTLDQIVWQSDSGKFRRVWRRSEDHSRHAAFMPRVSRFGTRSVPAMRPSSQPVLVPVWALRFTQFNINRDLKFTDRNSMLDMLPELILKPSAVAP